MRGLGGMTLAVACLAWGACSPSPPAPVGALALHDCAELEEGPAGEVRCVLQGDRDVAALLTLEDPRAAPVVLVEVGAEGSPRRLSEVERAQGGWVTWARPLPPGAGPAHLAVWVLEDGAADPPEGGEALAGWLKDHGRGSLSSPPFGWRENPRVGHTPGSAADLCFGISGEGRFAEALPSCDAAWRLDGEGLDPSRRAQYGFWYGYTLRLAGRPADAAAVLAEVEALAAAEGARRLQAKTQMLRANVLIMAGRAPEAARTTGPVLEVSRRVGDLQGQLELHRMRGAAWLALGDHRGAWADLDTARALASRLGDGEEEAKAHMELSKLAALLGDAASAVAHADAAAVYFLGEGGAGTGGGAGAGGARQEDRAIFLGSTALTRLWAAQAGQGQASLADVDAQLMEAVRLLKEAHRAPWAAAFLVRAAEVSLGQGQVAESRARLDEALGGEAGGILASDPTTLDVTAQLLVAEGRGEAALPVAAALGALADTVPEAAWRGPYRRGQALRALGEGEAAEAALEEAMAAVEAHAGDVDPQLQLGAFLGGREDLFREAVALALARGALERAFSLAERARRSHAAAVDAQARATALASAHPDAWATWGAELGALKGELRVDPAEAVLPGAEREARAAARDGARAALMEKAAAFDAWAAEEAPGAGGAAAPLAGAPEVRAALEEGEGLLAFAEVPEGLSAMIVTRGGLVARILPLSAQALGVQVDALRAAIVDGGDPRAAGAPLSAALMAPLAEALGGLRRVIVIPQGPLFRCPLHALPVGAGLMADQAEVVYTPSATAWLTLRQRRGEALDGPSLVVGDPERDLPLAAAEAREAGALLSAAPLLGEAATGAAVLGALARASIFHFAGHGRLDGPSFLGPHLSLAGGQRLDAVDLLRLPHGARRVVLSGCETAGGYRISAADVLGMTTAFLRTGATQVVASLWPVRDGEASPLTLALHDPAVPGGWSRRLALAQGRLRAQAHAPGGPAHRAWAAFALWGDGDPLTSPAAEAR